MAEPQPAPAPAAFKAASAAGRDWATVAKACADGLGTLPAGANLGLLYATGELAADVGSVLTFLRVRTWMECRDPGLAASVAADAVELARMEGLEAHARSADRRR